LTPFHIVGVYFLTIYYDFFFFFFFFSSRRRHTRFDCDWSSDVCSSDLNLIQKQRPAMGKFELAHRGTLFLDEIVDLSPHGQVARSEERRVGKECRSRWWPYQ